MKLEPADLASRLGRRQVNESRGPVAVRLREPVKAAIGRRLDRTLTVLVQSIDALGAFILTQSIQLKHSSGSG